MKTIFNGKVHNNDGARPALGTICRYAQIKNASLHESKALYKLENILVNGGRRDTYVLKNLSTGKIKNASIITVEENVSITSYSANIAACINGNIAQIDFIELEKELANCKYETVKKAVSLFQELKKTGAPAVAFEIWSYMICNKFTGKMAGMNGISTSVKLNPLCQKAQKDENSICFHCFAENIYSSQAYKLAFNTLVLCTYEFSYEQMPYLNCSQFRIESFGDLMNELQAVNYIKLAIKNYSVRFGWWSKRPAIAYNAYVKYFDSCKPENIRHVHSSKYLNHIEDIRGRFMLKTGDMISHVFTVFSAEYAIKYGVEIHCLKSVCIACKQCYFNDNQYFINEIVKEEQSKYIKMQERKLS